MLYPSVITNATSLIVVMIAVVLKLKKLTMLICIRTQVKLLPCSINKKLIVTHQFFFIVCHFSVWVSFACFRASAFETNRLINSKSHFELLKSFKHLLMSWLRLSFDGFRCVITFSRSCFMRSSAPR
jgi:hypothetical protein